MWNLGIMETIRAFAILKNKDETKRNAENSDSVGPMYEKYNVPKRSNRQFGHILFSANTLCSLLVKIMHKIYFLKH